MNWQSGCHRELGFHRPPAHSDCLCDWKLRPRERQSLNRLGCLILVATEKQDLYFWEKMEYKDSSGDSFFVSHSESQWEFSTSFISLKTKHVGHPPRDSKG